MTLLLADILGIPDVLFGGILGVVITFVGTTIQSILQRRHDANQRVQEREMSLRRDVYLPAAGALTQFQRYLGEHLKSNPDYLASQTMLQGVWEVINQIKLVATIETIETLDRLNVRFSELNSPLLKKSLEISRQEFFKDDAESSREATMAVLTQLASILQSWEQLEPVFRAGLKLQYESESAKLEDLQSKIDRLSAEITNRKLELHQDFSEAVTDLEMVVGEILLSVRKEMNFPIDAERFLRSIKRTEEQIQKITTTLKEEFKSEVLPKEHRDV